METPVYNVSQQELYKISCVGWRNFNNNLIEFTKFNPIYDEQYGVSCMEEVDAAKALPTENFYSSIDTDKRILLTRAADCCFIKWQNLKRYILNAYDTNHSTNMLNAAGQLFYTDASNYNWQSVKLLVDKASAFINNHKTDLVANENMPQNFGDNFDGTKNTFIDLQANFLELLSTCHSKCKTK